jgi:hypothetical protein
MGTGIDSLGGRVPLYFKLWGGGDWLQPPNSYATVWSEAEIDLHSLQV